MNGDVDAASARGSYRWGHGGKVGHRHDACNWRASIPCDSHHSARSMILKSPSLNTSTGTVQPPSAARRDRPDPTLRARDPAQRYDHASEMPRRDNRASIKRVHSRMSVVSRGCGCGELGVAGGVRCGWRRWNGAGAGADEVGATRQYPPRRSTPWDAAAVVHSQSPICPPASSRVRSLGVACLHPGLKRTSRVASVYSRSALRLTEHRTSSVS